jgi:phospholipid transport system substrate-binding protein
VYDLTVEGVSLVTSYRGTFADQVQQVGIDGLIKTLVDKNTTAASNAALADKADSK